MEIITSTANEKIKRVKKLVNDKKARAEYGLYVAEGVNLLKDLPARAEVEEFYFSDNAPDAAEIVEKSGKKAYRVTESVFKSMSDTITPSGLLALVKIPVGKPRGGNALFLDGVSDSGNLGTIIRTAAACDFKDIYLIGTADAYSPKCVRASMGGIFRVNIIGVTPEQALAALKNYTAYCLDMSGEPIASVIPEHPLALIAGSEAHGVSDVLKNAVDKIISLPMSGGMESLNVAVATGISMYYFTNLKEI